MQYQARFVKTSVMVVFALSEVVCIEMWSHIMREMAMARRISEMRGNPMGCDFILGGHVTKFILATHGRAFCLLESSTHFSLLL